MSKRKHPALPSNINLKQLRLKAGYTLEDVSRKLSVSVNTIFRWESGKVNPHPVMLDALIKLYKNG